MNLIEHRESSIPRIVDKVKANGLREQEYIGDEVDFRISIYRGQVDANNIMNNANDTKNGVKVNKERPQIETLPQIIEKNPSVTRWVYHKHLMIG